MSTLDLLLERLDAARRDDPLAPVTVIVPSRLAALQLRRRLAQRHAFANVRFEVVSRIAELIAAAALARAQRTPLARPIADYAAAVVARESLGPLGSVAELPGYARALRQTFRRLHRAGFRRPEDIPALELGAQAPEIARLYGRFRDLTAAFYAPEDLLDAAAARLRSDPGRVLPELGAVYVLPPARVSAAEAGFLDAVRDASGSYEELREDRGAPEERFILAPDPASEARTVARDVVGALQDGCRLDEIAVFYSGDRAYRSLVAQALDAAAIPVASMPGTPLTELAIGRGTLALARLPLEDYSRAAIFEFLGLAPLQPSLETASGRVQARVAQWRRVAREAGVTHGLDRWRSALDLFEAECKAGLAPDSDISEGRRRLYESDLQGAQDLRAFVEHLATRLDPLRRRKPAHAFITAFLALLEGWFQADAEGLAETRGEVEQLGTIDAVGGEFDLASFAEALEANLGAAAVRRIPMGKGVIVADYRLAAGLSFRRVFVCGAYEGAFPAITEAEPLLQDAAWSALREQHPHADDLRRRSEQARQAAARLLAVADGGLLTWSCPLQAANATRDYYPSALMVEAVRRRDPDIRTASDLRHAGARDWLRRPPSPLAAMLTGPSIDRWEGRLREAIVARRDGVVLQPDHGLYLPVALLSSRRSARFSEFEGNLAALAAEAEFAASSFSPTSLEHYGSCGFRYFLGSVLRLRGVEEPEEAETIGAAERGTLVHRVLERFFNQQRADNRPAPGERWVASDLERLIAIFDEEYRRLRELGRAGLDVYAGFDRRQLLADLAAFVEADNDFRARTGAVPSDFELRLPPTAVGDVQLSGFVDRIDRTPDGRHAWVIDYKTGSASQYEKGDDDDPFTGGTKLQLPVYVLAAAGADTVEALYWFVSRRGEFKQVPYQDTPEHRQRFEATLRAILAGQRAGAFPAVPGDEDDFFGGFTNCKYCDFDRLCSRRRAYEQQEKKDDPAMTPWHQVGLIARGEEAT